MSSTMVAVSCSSSSVNVVSSTATSNMCTSDEDFLPISFASGVSSLLGSAAAGLEIGSAAFVHCFKLFSVEMQSTSVKPCI